MMVENGTPGLMSLQLVSLDCMSPYLPPFFVPRHSTLSLDGWVGGGCCIQVINVERPGVSAYVTCGRDGTIRFWHKGTFAHLRSISHIDTIKTSYEPLVKVKC